MAVTVACQKIHRPVAFMRAHALVHQAHVFDKLGPIERGNGAHASDDVADGQVVGNLVSMFLLHDFIQADTLFAQPVIQKIKGKRGTGMWVVQALQDLHRKRLTQRDGRHFP